MKELYLTYRPKNLDDIIGNESVVNTIKSQLSNNRLPSYILLVGNSGCGKTTIARIIAREFGIEINDEGKTKNIDYKEINASNDNGVDFIRSLIEEGRSRPLFSKKKVVVMDEVHKLTSSSQSCLLKELEDTPAHIQYVFCTNEPEKLSSALKGRATIFNLKPLNDEEMEVLILTICRKEKIRISKEIMNKIILYAQGSSRVALVELNKLIGLEPEQMENLIGVLTDEKTNAFNLLKALVWNKHGWEEIANVLCQLNLSADAESLRNYILISCSNMLLNSSKKNDHDKCFELMFSFKEPFYVNGKERFVYACRDFYKHNIRKITNL